MGCKELIGAMAGKGYWMSPGGKTPAATLFRAIATRDRDEGRLGPLHQGRTWSVRPAQGVNRPRHQPTRLPAGSLGLLEHSHDPNQRTTPMTAFQKPQALKAALKMALYGPAGSGKTFTSLLVSEGLARHTGKRIAFCDTEYGTAFYGQQVAQRAVHPKAFDFDVLYTKSITEVLDAVRKLDPAVHGVLVIDSISHLWDACRNAYKGKLTKAGTIPLHAWSGDQKAL